MLQDLIQGLVDSGKIKARSKWKEVYPAFKDDERYHNMLGNPGSNALELFWDAVDALDQQLDAKIAAVEEAIARHNANTPDLHMDDQGDDGKPEAKQTAFVVGPDTTEEQFMTIVKANASESVTMLSTGDLQLVFAAVSFS